MAMVADTPAVIQDVPQTLYKVLGVSEDASPEDLTRAYRQRALAEHPDKGGDASRFTQLTEAYRVLGDDGERDVYDAELARARERAELVEGGRHPLTCGTTAGMVSTKQAQEPLRAKTEPTFGSKRQSKLRMSQPGKPQHCAQEWKGQGSGTVYLKMITDDLSAEQKTQRLLDKYATLPHHKEKRREWLNGIRGKDKQDLKALAKTKEEAERAKWAKWLAR